MRNLEGLSPGKALEMLLDEITLKGNVITKDGVYECHFPHYTMKELNDLINSSHFFVVENYNREKAYKIHREKADYIVEKISNLKNEIDKCIVLLSQLSDTLKVVDI